MSFTNYFFPLTRFYKGAVLFINYKKYSILSCRLLMHRASYFISPVLFNVREAVVSKEQFFLPGSKNLTFTTLARWLSVHKTKRDAKLNVLHFVLLIISFLLHGFKKGRFFLPITKSIRFCLAACLCIAHRTLLTLFCLTHVKLLFQKSSSFCCG